jgi:hypothetical protein
MRKMFMFLAVFALGIMFMGISTVMAGGDQNRGIIIANKKQALPINPGGLPSTQKLNSGFLISASLKHSSQYSATIYPIL